MCYKTVTLCILWHLEVGMSQCLQLCQLLLFSKNRYLAPMSEGTQVFCHIYSKSQANWDLGKKEKRKHLYTNKVKNTQEPIETNTDFTSSMSNKQWYKT